MHRHIEIRGARVNNLKNIDCDIPHERLTVITGPSGSGKSSLAFDTVYAEGQRRYIESMSAYARQFLQRIEKPDVDAVRHVLPAIALEQKNGVKNARSTVGTATEVTDFLRLLFATEGQTMCCGQPVIHHTPQTVAEWLAAQPAKSRWLIEAAIPAAAVPTALEDGFFRADINGETVDLNTQPPLPDTVQLIIDRVVLPVAPERLLRSVGQAFERGPLSLVNVQEGTRITFPTGFACLVCGTAHPKPTANLFSFNSPLGACPACEGFGRVMGLDLEKIIPNKGLSLAEGAIHPFTTPANRELWVALLAEAPRHQVRTEVPWRELTDTERAFVLNGSGAYEGVRPFFDWLETKKYKVHVRVFLAKYRGFEDCPVCEGSRLRPEAGRVWVAGRTIHQLSTLSIHALRDFFAGFTPQEASQRLVAEIQHRLDYLEAVGLGYLTLSRQVRTLSGGEAQRIHLSSALGTALTDTLYVLDEPTVGLHAKDTGQLLGILRQLTAHGNTVVVVEHDPEMILGADTVLDLGPSGGDAGGHVQFAGPVHELLHHPTSPTAQALKTRRLLPPNPLPADHFIEVIGASGHNLKHLTVRFPKNRLVCVVGVSGSGKTSLVKHTLFAHAVRERGETMDALPVEAIVGLDSFAEVVMVDQSPPGRSARSNPATYTKAYDDIRALFGESRKASVLGISASDFSFNTAGGRCETCEGMGTVTIDMQFMSDVTVVCQDCKGQRFNPQVLSVDLYGRNIFDVLTMTVEEALQFFKTHARIRKKLMPLADIGLGYLRLGQSTSTLSGGEAQRLKLASYLRNEKLAPCLFIFDEPTTGLHLRDIHLLVSAFRRLLEAGHSLIVVEHNLDFIAQADHLMELGPEGGAGGGILLAEGPPSAVAAHPASVTGRFLAEHFLPQPV
jgi:excinuclease ABC subunit A